MLALRNRSLTASAATRSGVCAAPVRARPSACVRRVGPVEGRRGEDDLGFRKSSTLISTSQLARLSRSRARTTDWGSFSVGSCWVPHLSACGWRTAQHSTGVLGRSLSFATFSRAGCGVQVQSASNAAASTSQPEVVKQELKCLETERDEAIQTGGYSSCRHTKPAATGTAACWWNTQRACRRTL